MLEMSAEITLIKLDIALLKCRVIRLHLCYFARALPSVSLLSIQMGLSAMKCFAENRGRKSRMLYPIGIGTWN